ARSQGPLAQLGTLEAFAGGGITAIGDRFLSVSGKPWDAHVRLAERQGDALVVAASWNGRLDFLDGADVMTQSLAGGLVALGARQERSLSVFSISAKSPVAIAKRSDVMLDGQIVSLTGRGARIWTCTRDFFRGVEVALVDVADPDAPVVVGSLHM